jgi:hypothetical protein
LVFHSSTITMMHGPVNIRQKDGSIHSRKFKYVIIVLTD